MSSKARHTELQGFKLFLVISVFLASPLALIGEREGFGGHRVLDSPCQSHLTSSSPEGYAEEYKILEAFAPWGAISVPRALSQGTVFLIEQQGHSYVLRAPWALAHPPYEAFASCVMQRAGLATPAVRLLPPREARRLYQIISDHGQWVAPMDGSEPSSITVYYPSLITGGQYLKKNDFSVSPALLPQIADHWALRLMLANPDFHQDNWLTDGRRVVSIDLAYVENDFFQGTQSLALRPSFNPVYPSSHDSRTDGRIFDELKRDILPHMSPTTKNFLRTVSVSLLRECAQRAQFTLSTLALQGILARTQLLTRFSHTQSIRSGHDQ